MVPIGAALASANALFHEAYAEARDAASRSLTLLIVLGDELILRQDGRRHSWSFADSSFEDLKVGAHVLVTTRALLAGPVHAAPNPAGKRRIVALVDILRRAQADSSFQGAAKAREAVQASLSLLDAVGGTPETRTAARRHWEATTELLEELTAEAARVRLAALHARVESALPLLASAARAELRVVVAGDHQARRRNLGVQYFERRLPPLANGEGRVIYGESVSSEEEAVAIAGTQLVDRALAAALFGDSTRLQEDVLGDATKKALDAMDLPRIA